MLEVMRTGTIAGIRIGASRRQVASKLGQPDAWMGKHPWATDSTVWRYGDLEFHFYVTSEASELWMLWCDDIPFPGRESARLQLDPWVLGSCRSSGNLSSATLLTALEAAGIRYHTQRVQLPYDHLYEVVLASGGRFGIGSRSDSHCQNSVVFIQIK